MTCNRRRLGLSLVEILFATSLLAIAMIGVAATFNTVQAAQSMTKEAHAASAGAAVQLEDTVDYVLANYSSQIDTTTPAIPANLAQFGFPVYLGSEQVGAGDTAVGAGAATIAGAVLKPAPTASHLWPAGYASWASANPTEAATHAGFVELDFPDSTRPNILRVTVTVAWLGRNGTPSYVRYSQVVLNPRFG